MPENSVPSSKLVPAARRSDTFSTATAAPDMALHWALLAISAGVLCAALLLRVEERGRVMLPLLEVPLPGTCTFKQYLGLDCPGCGLTRCFVCLAHGELRRALSFNPAGVLLFAAVAFQVPYRLAQIWRVRSGRGELGWGWGYWVLALIMAALLVQWLCRLVWNL